MERGTNQQEEGWRGKMEGKEALSCSNIRVGPQEKHGECVNRRKISLAYLEGWRLMNSMFTRSASGGVQDTSIIQKAS
jgi:hypothetical protein